MLKSIKSFIKKNLTLQSPDTLFIGKENGFSNLNFSMIYNYGK